MILTVNFSLSTLHTGLLRQSFSTPYSVPTPRVRITRTPSTGVHTSTRLNLTCITVMNPEVDTSMTVTHTWRGPSGSISRYSSRPTVSSVTRAGQMYWSSITFSSGMRASDSGTYYCTSSTSSASSYITTSGSVAASTRFTVGKIIDKAIACLLDLEWVIAPTSLIVMKSSLHRYFLMCSSL